LKGYRVLVRGGREVERWRVDMEVEVDVDVDGTQERDHGGGRHERAQDRSMGAVIGRWVRTESGSQTGACVC
jgi:hypothetical protein